MKTKLVKESLNEFESAPKKGGIRAAKKIKRILDEIFDYHNSDWKDLVGEFPIAVSGIDGLGENIYATMANGTSIEVSENEVEEGDFEAMWDLLNERALEAGIEWIYDPEGPMMYRVSDRYEISDGSGW